MNLFTEWDESLKNNKLMYFDGVWEEFFAQDGKLISSPPWGKITSIKIDNGKTNWSVPFGVENGKNIGLFNYGGLSITSSNLLIATGTVDNFVSIIDTTNGKTLWNFEMDAEGTAAPLIYNYNRKSFLAVISTGGLYPNSKKDSSLYIFGIKN